MALELHVPHCHSKYCVYVSIDKHFFGGLFRKLLISICLKFGGEVEENMILKNNNNKNISAPLNY